MKPQGGGTILFTGASASLRGRPMFGAFNSSKAALRNLAQAMAKAANEGYEKGDGSPPSVIADVVAKAITATKPKTRYAAGRLAKPILALRRFLPDRWFDRLILSQST